MHACPACSAATPEGARFCPACGRPLIVPETPAERKVVTTLFCDLVGFTRLSENADPEDVDSMLRQYAAAASHAVEIHGGVVEKFVGDGVVAVFGVPAAHEDDAERAIHAALRLCRDVSAVTGPDGAPVSVRIGINTGEALARLDLAPTTGDGFLAGDAVNTAARLQSAAPPGGILVGPATYALTSRLFRFEEQEPVALKGKAEPLPVWLVLAPVSRTGADHASFSSIFVGRRDEIARLEALLEQAIRRRSAGVALISGEPGIGKSRLLAEFFRLLDQRSHDVTWRQGRCLPYGEGIAFWPLGEIVKAQAGILDTDSVAATERKLARSLTERSDTKWIQERLRPLVGLRGAAAPQEESFSAWNRFIEQLAARRPLILVVEDLHWADDAMLTFLRQFTARDWGVPLLLLMTARTHFFQDETTFVSSLPAEGLIALPPLAAAQIKELLADLVDDQTVLHQLAASILERCGGNPLYAEELLRLLRERGLLSTPGDLGQEVAAALPQSLQAVIAARIDALPPRLKEYLTNAAVVGRRFWDGAVAALAGDGEALDQGLRRLAAAELIRVAPSSSMSGQREYVFWHALTRDVAYSQLTRGLRAEKHERVARWLEEQTGERAEDLADVLAHHYVTALEMRCELKDEAGADALRRPAASALHLAGSRALGLNAGAAERHLARAAALLPKGAEDRPKLLFAWGEALIESSELTKAITALEEGIREAREMGDDRSAAMALPRLSYAHWLRGDAKGLEGSAEAVALLERYGPTQELVRALESWAADLAHVPACLPAIAASDRAIAMAAELDLPERPAGFASRGMAHCSLGNADGLTDLKSSVDLALALDEPRWAIACRCNLGDNLCIFEGPRAARTVHTAALDSSVRFGGQLASCYCHEVLFIDLVISGEWDEALHGMAALDRELNGHGDAWDLVHFRATAALLLALTGGSAAAECYARFAETSSRTTPMLGTRAAALAGLAQVLFASGHPEGAGRWLRDCERLSGDVRGHFDYVLRLPHMVRLAHELGDPTLAERLIARVPRGSRYADLALAGAEARGAETRSEVQTAAALWQTTAEGWNDLGVPFEHAQALLGYGRCLLRADDRSRAETALLQADAVFERLGAKPVREEVRRLLEFTRGEPR